MSVDAFDLALNAADDWFGPVRTRRLIEAFGGAEAVLKADPAKVAAVAGRMGAESAAKGLAFARAFDVAAERERMAEAGAAVLKLGEPGYPGLLAALPDPPRLLYVRGELPPPGAPCVAVVGTREASDYGLKMAADIAAGLARAGVWVVSGLARGVDAAAHEACLDAGGRTVAVQGRGLSGVYPSEHRGLAERVASQGCLISQFSMATRPDPKRFPQRNALVSGLCRAVVVVEGERDSGSLITADLALEQGREVFAVPGRADEPMAQGPLWLIEQGARLVRGPEDVLEALGLAPPRPRKPLLKAAPPDADPGLDPASPAGRLWSSLGRGPAGLEALGEASGLDPAALAAAVTELELLGLLRQLPGSRLERGKA